MRKIAVLTYNVPHRKTYDALCLLKAREYTDITVFAQPMTYVKKRQPLISHRPELIFSIPETEELCRNLGYRYIEGEFKNIIEDSFDDAVFLVCGAGLLPEDFVATHMIVNAHPGFIPLARGLDAYKWSIHFDLPIGVTTHFLGQYVDAGEVLERREIGVRTFDTFHSVAQRLYENEIDMLVGAIDRIGMKHNIIIPEEPDKTFKRMPEEIEIHLYEEFEKYMERHAK